MANATLSAPQPIQIHRPVPAPAGQGEWSVEAIQALLDKPLMDLLFEAQTVHRQHWPAGATEYWTVDREEAIYLPQTREVADRRRREIRPCQASEGESDGSA